LKKRILLLLVFLVFLVIPAFAEMAEGILDAEIFVHDDYAIVVDGSTITTDVPPVEKGGVIFIPLRFAVQSLGADVTWNKIEKTAVISFDGGRTMRMTIGNPEVDLGDIKKIIPVPPFIFEGRTMIPLKPTAEYGLFRVEEKEDATIITSPEEMEGYTEPGIENIVGGTEKQGSLDMIREKALKDEVTKKLKPFVLAAWAVIGLLWLIKLITVITGRRSEGYKDMIIIGLFLTVGMYLVLYSGVMMSTYWAAIVILITSLIGVFSTETYSDKLVTMASTAQGAGLICTLFGLGLLIGPAIAQRDIAAIGYGIYVKIEPTITGLSLSILLNMIFGYEARRESA